MNVWKLTAVSRHAVATVHGRDVAEKLVNMAGRLVHCTTDGNDDLPHRNVSRPSVILFQISSYRYAALDKAQCCPCWDVEADKRTGEIEDSADLLQRRRCRRQSFPEERLFHFALVRLPELIKERSNRLVICQFSLLVCVEREPGFMIGSAMDGVRLDNQRDRLCNNGLDLLL